MADVMAQEPEYQQAISGVQARLAGAQDATAAPGGMSSNMLLQALMAPSPVQQGGQGQQEPPKWMWFIPGFGKGVAMRKQMDSQQEELKLRKQQLAGQEAMQKMQQLQLAQKIQQQERLGRLGKLYGGLLQNEDALDPDAKRELEGQVVQELAAAGEPDAIQKFIESRQSQRQLAEFNAWERAQQQGGAQAMPAAEMPAGGAATGGMPAPQQDPQALSRPEGGALTVGGGEEGYARDKLAYANLARQAQAMESTLRGYQKFAGNKIIKAKYDLAQDDLTRIRQEMKRLEERLTPSGSDMEIQTGIPKAYLSGDTMAAGRARKRQEDLEDYASKQEIAAAIEPEGAKEIREMQRKKLQLEVDKARNEQGGVLSPEQRMKTELTILDHVRQEPSHKQFVEVRNGYQNVQAGRELHSAQGDLAIINGYAKILDPMSAVREGEFANVAAAQGFYQRMGIQLQKFMKGDRLAEESREGFLGAAEALAKKKADAAKADLTSKYGPITKRAGLQFTELVPLEMGYEKSTASAAPTPQSAKATGKPRMDETTIREVMRLKGKTRKEVLDRAIAEGYEVP